jgi:uncharacterized membrane protein (UPF0127 family)
MILFAALAFAHAATLRIGATEVRVELADEPAERERGLMFRSALPDGQGMLFVYPDERPRGFWMKDTPLPLSIAYIDSAGRVVHLADMTPLSTEIVPSGAPARYALEVPQGWFARNGVRVGDVVDGLPPASAR